MKEKLKKIIKNKVFIEKYQTNITDVGGVAAGWIFDFRKILLVPEYIDLIAEIFWEKYKDKYPFQVCGLESAAIPLVTAIVMKSTQKKKPVNGFFIRKSRKKSGLLQIIEGNINAEKIIIVDDLINSANSTMRQIEVLEGLGKKVSEVFTILRFREMEYYYFLKERGMQLETLFTLPDFGIKFRKAKQTEKFLGDAFKTEWYFKSENPSYFYVNPKSAPVLDDKRIYFGSDSGYFWALNQKDGAVAWKYKVGFHPKGKSIFSSPAIYNGIVYFGAYDGNVYALDTETGKRNWVFMEADWVGSSPAIAPDLGLLFIGLEFGLWGKKGGIAALDMKTGKKKWEHITSEFTHSSPTYSKKHGVVAIGSNDSAAYLYSAKNGKLLWKFQTNGEIKSSFVFDEKRNIIIFGNSKGKLYILNTQTGREKFSYQAEFGMFSSPLLYRDNLYFSSLDKYLYCVDLDTQKLKHRFQTSGRIFASPAIVENKIYIGSNDGRLYEIEPETGEMTAFFQATERITNKIGYNPTTKRFFVPTFANEIYCLEKNNIGDEKHVLSEPPPFPLVKPLNDDEKRAALALSRRVLETFLGIKKGNIERGSDMPSIFQKKSSVGVSLWVGGFIRGCQIVRGKKTYDAIIGATKRAARDRRFKPIGIADLENLKIQISIISNNWNEIDKKRIKDLEIEHTKGYFLRYKNNVGWYLPEIFNLTRLVSMEQLIYRLANKKAGIDASLIDNENTKIYSFNTDDFMEGPNGGILSLDGPVVKKEREVTEANILAAAIKSADWMLSLMNADGSFTAILNPYGEKSAGYDWTRTAFSGWVLGEFGKTLGNKLYTDATERNFAHNKAFVFDKTVYIKNRPSVLSYMGQQALSLGHISDAVLCADATIEQIDSTNFSPIVFSQMASFLGIMALHGNEKYIRYAIRCAYKVKNSFDEHGTNSMPRSIAVYAELVNTFFILYKCTKDKKLVAISKEIASWIFSNQLENGAFKNTERSQFAYTRGTSKAVEALSLFNTQDAVRINIKEKEYEEKMKKAFSWLISMQYDELNTFFIDSHEAKKYMGGFRHDCTNAEAWIDSAAHFILATLRFYDKEKFISTIQKKT